MVGLGQAAATILTIGVVSIAIGIPIVLYNPKKISTLLWGVAGICFGALFVFLTVIIMVGTGLSMAFGRDLDGRYANSPLKPWFDSLHSGKGPCCSDADGTALSDVDWEVKDGHYRVRIEGQWTDVPDEALLKGPNRAGRTMVWPQYYRSEKGLRVEIVCFLPGEMT
jgi:hypothetical protein